jgi:hypothetical protein
MFCVTRVSPRSKKMALARATILSNGSVLVFRRT